MGLWDHQHKQCSCYWHHDLPIILSIIISEKSTSYNIVCAFMLSQVAHYKATKKPLLCKRRKSRAHTSGDYPRITTTCNPTGSQVNITTCRLQNWLGLQYNAVFMLHWSYGNYKFLTCKYCSCQHLSHNQDWESQTFLKVPIYPTRCLIIPENQTNMNACFSVCFSWL